ncbi:Vegetative incompatibility protein HET-E-1 OS=Podospora anserina GN=HET-E1 PE=4 SV=1 [Rhizoctonia solani AG-1 IB]|uniref:Vegetative incompatibility protein HET-E-1 n=1 Tax=Thanatephorus cucumeris (strain AG1-IB / isolate 7/3/14) TaxID=1108050 RepID=A0A0B7FHY6_THACB|nr:Vegetative incompatibility protein HET-E-1 OS=Podospora anserina GN=HET-E1 PE=4 SV=1 [Rhizoctonia solani AG-1 IB]
MQGLLPIFFSRTITMSSNKRRFDFLGVSSFGDSSRKRAKTPASEVAEDILYTSNPLTQPVREPIAPSQSNSSRKERAKVLEVFGRAALSKLKKSLSILQKGCGVFEPLVTAAETLQEVLRIIENALPNTDDTQDMASNLGQWANLLMAFIDENQPVRMSKQMENLIGALHREAEYLREQTEGRSGSTRQNEYEKKMQQLQHCHRQIEEAFRLLIADASLNIWKNTDNQLKESLLNGMLPAQEALYDSSYADKIERGPCLENTRVQVLDGIRSWMYGTGKRKVYWINGMAGTGKTTIAYSVCKELAKNERLAASFFVSRASSQCQDVSRILPTIAYQLARVSYAYRSTLCRILNKEPNLGQRKLSVQFEHLIELPLLKVAQEIPQGLVIVIDALDECSDPRTTELIVNLLMRHAPKLPVQFFLTSRPEPAITDTTLSRDGESRSVLELHNVEEQLVKADIKTYLIVQLAVLSPTEDQIEWIAEQAGVLFIYAATLVRYVLAVGSGLGSKGRLKAIITPNAERASKKDRAIDRLYKAILEGVLQDEDREEYEIEIIRRVLWTVVCVKEPVTKQTLAILARVNKDQVTEALHPLQSVIHVSARSDVASTLHASFPEFILNPLRSGPFSCDRKALNKDLASRCFDVMEQQLRFNLCGLESSYVFDCDVPNIEARVEAAISPELFYACRFWSKHLIENIACETLIQSLDAFLSIRFLFWMEVINLKEWMENGPHVLMDAKTWLSMDQERSVFLDDAITFLNTFTGNPINRSTPHIYVSHLPLGSKSNRIRQFYLGYTQGLVQVVTEQKRIEVSTDLRPHRAGWISSIAFSSNNSMIAAGSSDGTVHVWALSSGVIIAGPFRPQAGRVTTIVFSPDNLYLASIHSGDLKIRIWRIFNYEVPPEPTVISAEVLVPALCFSPDSAYIALTGDYGYGLMKKRSPCIMVMNTHTGEALHKLHLPSSAKYMAFSPDGDLLLSRLSDGRTQAWNSRTGVPHDLGAVVFKHHIELFPPSLSAAQETQYIDRPYMTRPSAYSSTWPALNSPKDKQVRCSLLLKTHTIVQDPITDELLSGPFGCDKETITAFAFSFDGTRVASGSERESTNGTYKHINIRVWDTCDVSHNHWSEEAWSIDEHGWLRDQGSRPILWIPIEWQPFFPVLPNRLVITPQGSMRVFLDNLLLGESWVQCYAPYRQGPPTLTA